MSDLDLGSPAAASPSTPGLGGVLGAVAAAGAAAAAGAVAGLVAERVVVGRSLRRRSANPWGLGQVRGPHRLVETTDGVQLYVEIDERSRSGRATTGADLTVVFVHGYALNLDSWHYQRLGLRGSARLVFYDQRSHGRSGRSSPDHATLGRLGEDLRAVLDAVAPTGPVVLVGHSMGGMTVMQLADRDRELFRERVVGVALLSTSSGRLAEVTLGAPAVVARAMRRFVPQVVSALGRNAELVERGRQISNDLGVLITRVYAFGGPTPVELSDFALEMINATPVDVLAQFYPVFLSHDALEALDVLDGIETLVLVGEQDKLTPPDHSRQIVQAVPGAQLVVLDPGGHLVMLERPDDVNTHLFDLLDVAARAATVGTTAAPRTRRRKA